MLPPRSLLIMQRTISHEVVQMFPLVSQRERASHKYVNRMGTVSRGECSWHCFNKNMGRTKLKESKDIFLHPL